MLAVRRSTFEFHENKELSTSAYEQISKKRGWRFAETVAKKVKEGGSAETIDGLIKLAEKSRPRK